MVEVVLIVIYFLLKGWG